VWEAGRSAALASALQGDAAVHSAPSLIIFGSPVPLPTEEKGLLVNRTN
jgi:hypothetical protein